MNESSYTTVRIRMTEYVRYGTVLIMVQYHTGLSAGTTTKCVPPRMEKKKNGMSNESIINQSRDIRLFMSISCCCYTIQLFSYHYNISYRHELESTLHSILYSALIKSSQ